MSRTVLVATDDGRDPAYAAARDAAVAWAAEHGARLILHDRSAESYFVDPYTTGTWTADVESGPERNRLIEPDDLEMLGRGYLADQVRAAREAGVEASGWLPTQPGANGMSDAVGRFSVDLVILPATLARPSLVDRVRGNTLDRFRQALSVEVVTADANGVTAASAPSTAGA